MNSLKAAQLLDKEYLGIQLSEFINEARSNVNDKIKLMLKLIASIKDENEKIISKSK